MKKTYISPATTIVTTTPATMLAASRRASNWQVDFGEGHGVKGDLSISGQISGKDGGESDTRRHIGSGLWED